MDGGAWIGRDPNDEWRTAMTMLMNRILDVVASFAAVGLALTVAGATAVLGA